MGATLKAIGDTGKLLRHNTMLWAGGTVLTIVFLVVYGVVSIIPLVSLLSIFIVPAFATGLLGMAYAARNGDAGLDDFASSVGDNYLPYLASTLIMVGVSFVLALLFAVIAALTVGFGAVGAGAGTGRGAAAGLSILVFVVMLVVFLLAGLVGLVVQFFDVAIVVDDAGPVSAFTRSWQLVASAPVSVLGYTAVRAVAGGLLFGLPWVILALFGFGAAAAEPGSPLGGGFSMAMLVSLGLWGLVVLPLGIVVLATYHVAYFNRHKASGTV